MLDQNTTVARFAPCSTALSLSADLRPSAPPNDTRHKSLTTRFSQLTTSGYRHSDLGNPLLLPRQPMLLQSVLQCTLCSMSGIPQGILTRQPVSRHFIFSIRRFCSQARQTDGLSLRNTAGLFSQLLHWPRLHWSERDLALVLSAVVTDVQVHTREEHDRAGSSCTY